MAGFYLPGDKYRTLGRLKTSTGPRSRERGENDGITNNGNYYHTLQRGRADRSPEGRRASGRACMATCGFNGAAPTRARRARRKRWRSCRRRCFNEAALTGARTGIAAVVSTGPRSPERGEVQTRGEPDDRHAASTGPRSPERGETAPDDTDRTGDDASTGPRSPERGEHLQVGSGATFQNGFNGATLT